MKQKTTAILLAGGSGRRMGASCKKQYMLLAGKPILYYSLKCFQESEIDEIILVTNEADYCREELIEPYQFHKVVKIVPGGENRYDSVWNGVQAMEQGKNTDIVLIHDGARPLVTPKMIHDSIAGVRKYRACVVGMPVKDTIKITDEKQFAIHTPDRNSLWAIQTPQSFEYDLLVRAYHKIFEDNVQGITDDAMIVEHLQECPVKVIEGDYRNIKITTPEDLLIGEAFLKGQMYQNGD